jgi:predicted oxidoreductase
MMVAVEERRLGRIELRVGPIAYGCWRFAGTTVDGARAKIEAALDHGMTLIDTADIYGFDGEAGFGSAEELLGKVLAAAPGLRHRMVLATKGGIQPGVPYDSSPVALRQACEASLRRLGVDHIDLYQVHRPDLLAHPADVAAVLVELRESGKVRELGVSNHSPSQVAALRTYLGDVPLVTTQPELSLLHLDPIDDGTLDDAMAHRLTPLAWSPLAGGRIASGDGPDALVAALDALATRESTSRSAIALAWVLAHPAGPIPIIGTQQPARIAEAAEATAVHLTRADWYGLVAAAGRELP